MGAWREGRLVETTAAHRRREAKTGKGEEESSATGQISFAIFAGSVIDEGGRMEAYCVKCKTKREMKDAKQVKMKNGRSAMKGRCPTCGTGLYRILGK